jgi:hypothetical protein
LNNVFTDEDRGSDQTIAGAMETDISVETLDLRREMAAQPRIDKLSNISKMLDALHLLRRRLEPPGPRSHVVRGHDEDISGS